VRAIDPGVTQCFLGFELAEDTRAYLESRLIDVHRILLAKGWPARLVKPDKWHITLLYFSDLPPAERAVLWSQVEAAAAQGAWADAGFHWRGLALWPSSKVVVLESEKISALPRWGLESWLDNPICVKGELGPLKSYRPHVTVMRLQENTSGKLAPREWATEWKDALQQVEPIDLQRVRVDRITFFLSDYSGRYHRYIRESTLKIG
jgi:2'-5' RNA ligase